MNYHYGRDVQAQFGPSYAAGSVNQYFFAAFDVGIIPTGRSPGNLLGLLETCGGAASGVLPTLFRCRPFAMLLVAG